MISLFTLMSALMLSQVTPKPAPASLSLADIIKGIEKNQEIWRAQKSWMVRYTNSRERIDPPPGTYVSYGDNQIVNARKGAWAFLSEDQATGGGADPPSGRRTWCLWKDKQYTERNQKNVTSQDGHPVESSLFLNVWLYPMSLCRDSLSDTFSIPEEAYQEPEGLWIELPRCLKTYGAHYRIRKDIEDVDGFPCHVVEWAGKDVIWIDPEHGFNIRRRKGLQPSGNLLYEFKASYFKERAPGIWLPDRQTSLTYNTDRDPEVYRGRVAYVMINALHEARFNDVPDSLFDVPLGKDVRVFDNRKRN